MPRQGINRGHMKLHAKNIAIMAGATGDLIDIVSQKLLESGHTIDVLQAKAILQSLQLPKERPPAKL
jgi:hydroxymethylglutaryl-CoA reductase